MLYLSLIALTLSPGQQVSPLAVILPGEICQGRDVFMINFIVLIDIRNVSVYYVSHFNYYIIIKLDQ